MTTPAAGTTKRRPPKAPVPAPAPEPQWPAVDAAAATLRAMPDVAYLFTEKVPATRRPIVITKDMDTAMHEYSDALRALTEEHFLMLDEWEVEAHERVFAPLRAFCRPRHARPTDAAEGAADASQVPPAAPDEPDEAA